MSKSVIWSRDIPTADATNIVLHNTSSAVLFNVFFVSTPSGAIPIGGLELKAIPAYASAPNGTGSSADRHRGSRSQTSVPRFRWKYIIQHGRRNLSVFPGWIKLPLNVENWRVAIWCTFLLSNALGLNCWVISLKTVVILLNINNERPFGELLTDRSLNIYGEWHPNKSDPVFWYPPLPSIIRTNINSSTFWSFYCPRVTLVSF